MQTPPNDRVDRGLDCHNAIISGNGPDVYRHRLILQFISVNLVGFALLSAAWFHGYVGAILAADQTRFSLAIFALFLVGLGSCGLKVWQTSWELNQIRSLDKSASSRARRFLAKLEGRRANSRSNYIAALRLRLSHRIGGIRQMANCLILFGLIGTVTGFIIALSGVDPQNAANVTSIEPMISTLIAGMSVALYTTLVGSVLNVWLMVNNRLLASGTVSLITTLIELGECHAGS